MKSEYAIIDASFIKDLTHSYWSFRVYKNGKIMRILSDYRFLAAGLSECFDFLGSAGYYYIDESEFPNGRIYKFKRIVEE